MKIQSELTETFAPEVKLGDGLVEYVFRKMKSGKESEYWSTIEDNEGRLAIMETKPVPHVSETKAKENVKGERMRMILI